MSTLISPAAHCLSMDLEERLKDLTRIACMPEPVLRNLLITQRYHELSHELAVVLGQTDANWSTFATWASKTAGQSIREEEVPPELAHFLKREAELDRRMAKLAKRLGPFARLVNLPDPFDLARAIIAEVARQIAEGNLRVYAELAPLFATFARHFKDAESRTPEGLESFLAKLTSEQPHLKNAFTAYYEASICEDLAHKSQLILLANVSIGLHEQMRLQENIAGALDAPFSPAVYERFGAVGPAFLHPLFRGVIRVSVKVFAAKLLDDWQRLATRFLMKLATPSGDEIPLGEDLPPATFDPLLTQLTYQPLINFLLRYDPDLETTKGCAAANWTLLDDRMRFIGELFRVSQRDVSWFDPPFEETQRIDIEAGRIPCGPLG